MEVIFNLYYKTLLIGTLILEDFEWTFSYSVDFKTSNLDPLIEFPDKKITYKSNLLFPFFMSRIPSRFRQNKLPHNVYVKLLKQYGYRVVHDPFELLPDTIEEDLMEILNKNSPKSGI